MARDPAACAPRRRPPRRLVREHLPHAGADDRDATGSGSPGSASSATACIRYCSSAGWRAPASPTARCIVAATPVLIALMVAALGRGAHRPLHWAGTLLSLAGIYIVVGHGASSAADAARRSDDDGAVVLLGDLHVGSRPLMRRHSPVGVTGLSMAIGTLLYVPLSCRTCARCAGGRVSVRHVGRARLLGALRPVRRVHDLVRRGARDRQRADVGLLEPGADRRDGHGRCLPRRAARSAQDRRGRRGAGSAWR